MKSKNKSSMTFDDFATCAADVAGEIWVREFAFWVATNFIASALEQCEFRTYQGGKEVFEREYYLWNVEPNKNQSRHEFLHELVAKICRNNEALVFDYNGDLLIADNFIRTPYALFEDTFSGVSVKGFSYNRTFKQSEVLVFKWHNENMRAVTSALNAAYSKLLAYTMTAYQRSRGTKGIFMYDALPQANTEARVCFDALINEKMGKWLVGDSVALPLGNGQKWQELEHKTYSNESTRDIRAMINDVLDFTANGLGIAPPLLRGDVQTTKDALQQTITQCIEPFAWMIENEGNRKRNGYDGFVRGDKMEIYTGNIEHHDLLNSATSIDKLISSGWSPNEVRRVCGEPQLDEPWAKEHKITKNYAPADGSAGGGNT
jgi:Phage portal protein.